MEDNKTFNHVMVDIETMGTESYSSILSIGAVKFDINTGECGDYFHKTISLESSLKLGLIINSQTLQWWLLNSNESKVALFEDANPIGVVLYQFSQFITKEVEIWGNSARFDLGLLQNAYDKIGTPIPWDFRKERCLRTLVSFKPEIKENFEYTNVKHNALDDCYNQIRYATKIWNTMNKVPESFGMQKIKCQCACHRQSGITHMVACCNNGYL